MRLVPGSYRQHHQYPTNPKGKQVMKIGDLLMTLVVAVAVAVFVFFRCRSILEEKDEPAQHHLTAQQGQQNPVQTP